MGPDKARSYTIRTFFLQHTLVINFLARNIYLSGPNPLCDFHRGQKDAGLHRYRVGNASGKLSDQLPHVSMHVMPPKDARTFQATSWPLTKQGSRNRILIYLTLRSLFLSDGRSVPLTQPSYLTTPFSAYPFPNVPNVKPPLIIHLSHARTHRFKSPTAIKHVPQLPISSNGPPISRPVGRLIK